MFQYWCSKVHYVHIKEITIHSSNPLRKRQTSSCFEIFFIYGANLSYLGVALESIKLIQLQEQWRFQCLPFMLHCFMAQRTELFGVKRLSECTYSLFLFFFYHSSTQLHIFSLTYYKSIVLCCICNLTYSLNSTFSGAVWVRFIFVCFTFSVHTSLQTK